MTAVQEFDYNKFLQECLTKHLKILQKDIHPSHNLVYNGIIKRKIQYQDIEFQAFVTMIDSEIIIYKDKLKRERTRPATDKHLIQFNILNDFEMYYHQHTEVEV